MNAPTTARLSGRAVVRVSGPEARPFLNRLLTQEVDTLAPGALRFGALLTPQGRVLHDLFLWGEADGVRVDVAAQARDDLMRRLDMFRLRAAVDIATEETEVRALWDAPTAPSPEWRRDPRLADAGWRALGGGVEIPANEVEEARWTYRRFALGLPEAADGLSDRAYATEADLDLLNGVDFSKGCFIGQETTSRMKRRGGVRSRVLPLAFEADAPEPGCEIMAGDLRAGEVTAAAGDHVLALLRLDRCAGPLACGGVSARLVHPPWLPAEALLSKEEVAR